MATFWQSFLRVNAQFLAKELRKAADQLDILAPGSPKLGYILFGGINMASIEVVDTSAPLNATVSFLDAEGNPTTADDVPQWSSDNDAVVSVVASADGLSAEVTIGGPGAAVVSVNTTNTDGSTASAQGTVTVLPGDAVVGSVEFAAPVV
jgi:hypothetical protein